VFFLILAYKKGDDLFIGKGIKKIVVKVDICNTPNP
jgi:hypothetical protein